MWPKPQRHRTVPTRFIEPRASETVVETAGDADINCMATEVCATTDILCRGLEIGTVVSALIDSLDWPHETKLACLVVLAGYAERDMAWRANSVAAKARSTDAVRLVLLKLTVFGIDRCSRSSRLKSMTKSVWP